MGVKCTKEITTATPKCQETYKKQRDREHKPYPIILPTEPIENDKYKFCGGKTYKNYYIVEKCKLIKQLSIQSILDITIKYNSNDEIEFEEDNKIKQNLDLALRRNEITNERKDKLFYNLLYIITCFIDSGIENIVKFKSNILFNENNEMFIGEYLKQELSTEYTNPINSFCMIIYELTDNIKIKSLIRSVMINKLIVEELKLAIEDEFNEKYCEDKTKYFKKYLYSSIYHPLSEERKKTVDKWVDYYKKSNDNQINLYSTYFSDSVIEYFSLKIPTLSNLTKLNIICNINYKKEQNDEAIIYLSRCFKFTPFLTSLHLDIRITLDGMIEFTDNIQYIPELTDLGLENNRSGEEGLKYLFEQFSYISKLEHVSISECDNTDENITALNNNLQFLTNLKDLNMECTGRSFIAFETFAKDIYKCKSLELLNITLIDLDEKSSLKIDRIFRGYVSKDDLNFNIIY